MKQPSEFWTWFLAYAKAISADPESTALLKELDHRVASTWPQLSWEIGPAGPGSWYLAISPSLDRQRVPEARKAAASAPTIPGWTIVPFRPRKAWDGTFELETATGTRTLCVDGWRCVVLRYADGHCEVMIAAPEAAQLHADERWIAAAVALEGILGEEFLLEMIDSFSLEPLPDERNSSRYKPVKDLPKLFGLS